MNRPKERKRPKLGMLTIGAAMLGVMVIAFYQMWPSEQKGFGGQISTAIPKNGSQADVLGQLQGSVAEKAAMFEDSEAFPLEDMDDDDDEEDEGYDEEDEDDDADEDLDDLAYEDEGDEDIDNFDDIAEEAAQAPTMDGTGVLPPAEGVAALPVGGDVGMPPAAEGAALPPADAVVPPPPAAADAVVPPPPAAADAIVPPPPAAADAVVPPPPAAADAVVPPPPAAEGAAVPPPPAAEGAAVPPPPAVADAAVPPPAGGVAVPPPEEGVTVAPPAEGVAVPPPMDGAVVPPPAEGAAVPPAADTAAAPEAAAVANEGAASAPSNLSPKWTELREFAELTIPEGDNFKAEFSQRVEDPNWQGITINEGEFAHLSERIPECAKTRRKPRSFIMVMSSHAGSTALISQLVQHPKVYWSQKVHSFEPLHSMAYMTDPQAALEWTRDYFTRVQALGYMPGFKMEIIPILKAMDDWKKLAEEFDTAIIFNYRVDHLKRAVGRYSFHYLGDKTAIGGINKNAVDQTGSQHDRCSVGVGCTFNIDNMSNLHCIMTRSWKTYTYKVDGVKELTNDCALNQPYEDYLKHPTDVLHQALDFLGLERVDVEAAREKATSDDMCKTVENFGELCAAFAECALWKDSLVEDEEGGCSCKNYTYTSHGGDSVNPLCSSLPVQGSDYWCYGICELCPETIRMRETNPKWPMA